MVWCTLQACSLSRHVAAEVRRQARLVLGLGGSLDGAALPLVLIGLILSDETTILDLEQVAKYQAD